MSLETLFLNVSVDKLNQSVDRIAVCLTKLSDDQIWGARPRE